MKPKFHLILIYLFLLSSTVWSQKKSDSGNLSSRAEKLFVSENYEEAMPLYSQLLSLNPSNPVYSFYFGACLVENNTDIKKSILYLEYAKKKISDRPLIFYYLGKAYHLNYQFSEALQNLHLYKGETRGVKKARNVEREIAECNNGLDLVRYVNQLIVLNNKKIKNTNFYYSYDLSKIGGKIVIKPEYLKTKVDKKRKQKELIFVSNKNLVFFSSLGKNKKGSRDLYKTQKDASGKWLPFENLGPVINTPYDEDFPFLQADGKTLYFASKGHNSMGGYDIFCSVYDSIQQEWGEPVNLDFPINTPYDDLLYVVDSTNNIAYFTSNREAIPGKVNVYKIRVDHNPQEKKIENIEEIQEIAQLKITPLADIPPAEKEKEKKLAKVKTNIAFVNEKIDTTKNNELIVARKIDTQKDYTLQLNKDIALLKKKKKELEKESVESAIITNNKIKELIAINKEIANLQSTETESLAKLTEKASGLSAQALLSAQITEQLSKDIIQKEKELKISQMLLADSSNNNIEELMQNISANKKFLQKGLKNAYSSHKLIVKKQAELKTAKEELRKKQKELHNVSLEREALIADYQQINEEIKETNDKKFIKQLEKDQEVLAKDIRSATSEKIKKEEAYLIAKNKKIALEKELNFLKNIKEEKSSIQEQLAENQNIDKKQIITDAKVLHYKTQMQNKAINTNIAKKLYIAENVGIIKDEKKPEELDVKQGVELASIEEPQSKESNNSETSYTPAKEPDNKAISSIKITQVQSLEARKTLKKAKEHALLSDSLNLLIAEKEKLISANNNQEEVQIQKNELAELKKIAAINRTKATKLYHDAQSLEADYQDQNEIAINESANTQESEYFDFKENDKKESIETQEYKKASFQKNLNDKQLQKIQLQKSIIEKSLNQNDISEESKKVLQKELLDLNKQEKIVQAKINNNQENIDLLKDDVSSPKLNQQELYLSASQTKLDSKINLTPAENASIEKATAYQKEAENIQNKYRKKNEEIIKLKTDLKNSKKKKTKERIQEQINLLEKESQELYTQANNQEQLSFVTQDKIYQDLLDKNRKYSSVNNQKLADAYAFEKESELLKQKASLLRKEAKNQKVNKSLKTQLLTQASQLEQLSLQEQKKALNIYINQKEENTNTELANNNDEIIKLKQAATQISPEEAEIMEKSQQWNSIAETKETKAKTIDNNIQDLQKEYDNTFLKKDRKKIAKKITKAKEKAKESYINSFQSIVTADSLKLNLCKEKLNKVIPLCKDKTKKAVAKQYLYEADFYKQEALKIKIKDSYSLEEIKKLHQQRKELEQKAIEAQELAYKTIMQDKTDNFIAENSLIKINPLSREKPVDTKLVRKVQTQKIIEKLETNAKNTKLIKEAQKYDKEALKLQKEAQKNHQELIALTQKLETSTPEEKKKLNSEIEDLKEKELSYAINLLNLKEPVNVNKYDFYKSHIREYRINGASDKALKGHALEKEANHSFQKAKRLREKAFNTSNVQLVYEILQQAEDYENKAIDNLEKAYTLYLNLEPSINKDVEKRLAEKTDSLSQTPYGNILILSRAQIDTTNIDNNLTAVANEEETANEQEIATTNAVEENVATEEIATNETANTQNAETTETEKTINTEEPSKNSTVVEETTTKETTVINITSETTKETAATTVEKTPTLPKKQPFVLQNTVAYSATNPIPMNPPLPEGIIYKIQIGAFLKTIPQDAFNGLTPVTGVKRDNSRFTRYFVGEFVTFDAANTALPHIRKMGYKDAFIVAFKNNKRTATYIAKKESKQQDNYKEMAKAETQAVLNIINTPESQNAIVTNNNSENTNTVETAVLAQNVYTVQVGVYKKPVSASQLKNLKPLYSEKTKSGFIRYTVGQYTDKQEALKQKARIRQLGISDAFVTFIKNRTRTLVNGEAPKQQIENTVSTTTETPALPKSLDYRVQIGAYSETVPVEVVSSFLKMAENNKLEHFIVNEDITVYTVGRFKSYQQAVLLKDKLIQKGLTDAFVIAYDGDRKISIEEAQKKLQP